MKTFLYIFQVLLKSCVIFLIFFIWLRYIFSSVWLAVIISIAITLILELLSKAIKRNKGIKASLKLKEKEDAENMFFSILRNERKLDFYYNLAKTRHCNVSKNKKYITVHHPDKQDVIMYPFIKFQSLSIDNVVEIIEHVKKPINKLVILCNDYDKNLTNQLKDFSTEIVLLDKYQTYKSLYQEYDFYPEITEKPKSKVSYKHYLTLAFNRSKTKGYLFSAIVLFIASFFVQYNLYYYIFSTILLIFSLISFATTSHNIKVVKELL